MYRIEDVAGNELSELKNGLLYFSNNEDTIFFKTKKEAKNFIAKLVCANFKNGDIFQQADLDDDKNQFAVVKV